MPGGGAYRDLRPWGLLPVTAEVCKTKLKSNTAGHRKGSNELFRCALFFAGATCENRKNVAQCRKKPSMYLISVRNYYKLSFDIIADCGMRANEIGWQLVINRLLFRFRAGNAAKAWNTGRSFERQVFG